MQFIGPDLRDSPPLPIPLISYASHPFLSRHDVTLSDHLLESPIDGRADFSPLVEINGRHGALADSFRRELEFLSVLSVLRLTQLHQRHDP